MTIDPVILSPDALYRGEGSAFQFSDKYRFFVACWLLRMTLLMGFSACCQVRAQAEMGGRFEYKIANTLVSLNEFKKTKVVRRIYPCFSQKKAVENK
jgi:hypothetical protein